MDRTGCLEGYATDRVFLYGSDYIPGTCDASLALFTTVLSLLSILRCIVAAMQYKVWHTRERHMEQRLGKRRSRWPVLPATSLFQAAALTAFTILTSLDLANAQNGISGLLLGVFYTPLCVVGILVIMRLTRLGKRLIPLSRKQMSDDSSSADANQQFGGGVRLDRADSVLKIMLGTSIVASIVLPASLIIAGPIAPIYTTFQAGAVSLFVLDYMLAGGVSYQYYRLLQAIKSTEYQKSGIRGNLGNENLGPVIRKMRLQQFIWLGAGSSASIIWILNASRAVLPHYWYTFLHFGVEVLFISLSTYSFAYRSNRRANETYTGAMDSAKMGLEGNMTNGFGPSANPDYDAKSQSAAAVTVRTG